MYAAKKLAGSNIHIYSSVLVSELSRYVAKKFVEHNLDKELKIGVICPYRSQSQLITKLIEQISDIPSEVKVNVGTIHSFQGDECNIVFAVFNPPTNLKSGATEAHINNTNIINVAISRAQDYLCILMPSPDCEGYRNLIGLNQLGHIAKNQLKDMSGILNPGDVERLIFGSPNYLYNNIFVTSHQTANVYTKPAAHYEVRCDDKSIDIQVDETVGFNPTITSYIPTGIADVQDSGMVNEQHIETVYIKDDNLSYILSKPTKKIPDFKFVKLGPYRVGVIGRFNPIIHILKSVGGVSSKNITYNGRVYGQGYSIQNYNLDKVLEKLEEEGWDIESFKDII